MCSVHSAHLKGDWQSQHKHRKQRKSKDKPTNWKESMQKGCAAAGARAKAGMARGLGSNPVCVCK